MTATIIAVVAVIWRRVGQAVRYQADTTSCRTCQPRITTVARLKSLRTTPNLRYFDQQPWQSRYRRGATADLVCSLKAFVTLVGGSGFVDCRSTTNGPHSDEVVSNPTSHHRRPGRVAAPTDKGFCSTASRETELRSMGLGPDSSPTAPRHHERGSMTRRAARIVSRIVGTKAMQPVLSDKKGS